MNDLKFDILNAPKAAQSELDRIMQSHIDSGQFSKEQLAEIRKREANKIKEAKKAEQERLRAAKEGPTEGSQVEAFNKEVDSDKNKITKELEEENKINILSGKGLYDREENVDISGLGGLVKVEKKNTEVSYAFKNKELPEDKKQVLIDQFGTSDGDEIIANTLTNEDGSRKDFYIPINMRMPVMVDVDGNEVLTYEVKGEQVVDRDDKTYLNPNDLPMFDDEEIMEYLYAPYMEDAETMGTKAVDFIGGLFGADTDYATPENERQKTVFKDRFSSRNTDRSGIIDYITAKQSNYRKEQFDTKYDFNEGLDISTTEWSNVAQLSGYNEKVFNLFQQGKAEEAVQLNEDNGMYTLYNKDGKNINWSELSDEDKASADPNNISTVSKEDEERAIILAERNKPAQLQMQQMQNRHDLTAAISMYRDTHGDVKINIDPLGDRNIGYFRSVDDFNTATFSASENNSLISGLVEAIGEDEVTRNYNEKLKKFLITGRALELNQDLSKLAEEGSRNVELADIFNFSGKIQRNVADFLYNPDEFADYTTDEQVEAFSGYMEETGTVMNDDWKRVTREGGDWLLPGGIEMFGSEVDVRDIAEGGRDFVKHIAPLVASLYITKKIPLGLIGRMDKARKAYRITKSSRTLGGEISKKFTGIGNYMKKLPVGRTKMGKFMTDATLGGVEELVYLSIADQVGGKLFDMDPMVYNPETDELNWEFAFGLGVGNVLGKKIIGRLMQTNKGSAFMSRVSKYKTLEKAFERGIGATSGVGSMELAKIFSGDSELVKLAMKGGELTEDQKNEMKVGLVKTMASDWLGMFMLGYITPGGKVGEAITKDIENYNINKLNTSKDAKKLGIKENADTDAIEAAVNKKKNEVTKKYLKSKKDKDGNRTKKAAETRDKELVAIKEAADNINGRAHIREAKKLISKDKKRLAELERQIYVFNRTIGIGKKPTGKQMLELHRMNKAEFDYLLKKMNNPRQAEMLAATVDYYRAAVEYVKEFKNITSRKETIKLLEETVEFLDKTREIEILQAGKGKKNDAKIKLLQNELEPIKEKHTASLEGLKRKYTEAVNREMLVAKKIAESLGAEFEIAKNTEDYIAKGGEKGTVGEYVNGKIIVDPVAAARAKTIGTGIHEVVHHILKDAFKRDGKVTKEGIAIIDKFLESLPEKDRKFLEKEIEQRDYKSKKKEDYYEEHLTLYVEGLKNKDIKLDLSTAEKVQNVFLPYINKVFSNIGKKTVKFSTKDANSLKDMLNDIFSESERLGNMSKYDVKNFMVESPKKTADAYEAFTEVSQMNLAKAFSKYPEMKKINAVGEKYTRQEWKDGKWLEGYDEILPDIIKVLTKKSFEANAKYPGIIADPQSFAFQVANELGGLNPNQQKIGGHVRNFNIDKKIYDKEGAEFGLSGWINDFADLKLLNVLKRADKIIGARKTKSLDVEEVKELVDEGPSAYDIIETKITNETARRILLETEKAKIHELMFQVNKGKGNQAKEIHDGIRQRFTTTTPEGKEIIDVNKLMDFVSGKKMKNLPRLVLPETIKLFIGERRNKKGKLLYEQIADKIENNKNLDQQDIKALQDGLDRWIPMIAEYVISEGFVTKGVKYMEKGIEKIIQVPAESTGIPNVIKRITHNKRSIAGETTITGRVIRAKENFFGHYKKPITVKLLENLRESIGIMKDGTRNLATRDVKKDGVVVVEGVGETLKGVITLTEKMFTSQGVREPMYEMGKIFEPEMLAIADGKPSKSYSNVAEKMTLKKLKLSYQLDVVKTGQFLGKVQYAYETLPDHKWEEFKDKNGREVIEPIEEFLLTAENKADKSNYTKDIMKGDTPAHAYVRDNMVTLGGMMKDGYKIIVMDSKGKKILSKAGENQIEGAKAVIENMLPILANIKNLTNKLGFKGLSFDGRTLPNMFKGVDIRNTTSKLSEKLVKEMTERFKKMGINVDAILDAVDMVKESPLIKKSLNVFMKSKGSVAEKFAEQKANGNEKAIEYLNEGNANTHKALVETSRELFAEGIISVEYVFNEGKLQTNIVTSKRAVSMFGMVYVVDGKMIADTYGTSKQMSHTNKPKDFKGTLQEYYNSDSYRKYIKDWMESAEWTERYNENLKDPNLKDSADKNKINEKTQAEKQTIEDLVPFNEHINGNANAMVKGNNYIFSNGKGGKKALDAIGRDHVTAWVPAYIAKKMLDVAGPQVSKKGYARLTAYLPSTKLNNMYTYDGKKASEYIAETQRFKDVVDGINNVTKKNINKTINSVVKNYSKLKGRDQLKDLINVAKATNLGRLSGKKSRGMSTFDFDETVGVSDNYVIATRGKETKRIASNEWPFVGEQLKNEGWKMDFSDFNKVTKGKPGPLLEKMRNQIKKFGPDNVFILTARQQESAKAIHEWLKSEGVNIPLKNITGLGNSTGEAKAMWMLEKFSEGYNDMYFVDDALPNVKAVKDVLNQLDIKSDVQIARQFSRTKLSKSFNDILEEVTGIKAEKTYGEAKGRLVGEKKGKYKVFGTPGMEDFAGLVTYAFAGKGKRGEAHIKFFNDNLQRPFNRAYNEIHNRKQRVSEDYKALRKSMPEVKKILDKKVGGIYNVDQAIRVYNWTRAGYEIPGLSKTDLKKLVGYVESNPKLVAFADQLSKITMLPEGYLKPADQWLGENITMDMNNVVERVFRKEALSEFVENRKAIFGEWKGGKLVGENMNKIESAYGPKHREALENMLWRMENGTNRTVGADSNTNKWMNWVNDATGTIMFFNQKSAVLQTISSLNYVNGSFNNPLRAAQAFANQPQYWKDFAMIFNSNMLVQRRAGLKINIEAAELLERVGSKKGGFARFRAFLLEKGFIPTKYADSFAIASGGATFYRNSVRKYKKQGLSEKQAETKAWEDFMQMTEATQQSSRPDLISMQQASALGRPILAFANTPMQMFRRHKRRIQDIANRRGNTVENVASALYYGFAQTMIFSFLANAMFAVDDESDDPKDIKFAEKKKSRHVQTIVDSYMRGMGTGGAAVSALKNGLLRFFQESEKNNPDYANVVIDMLNVSPPIGSKARKLYSAGKSYMYDRDVIPEMGFSLDNPAVLAIANVISATTNMPTDRVVMKLTNLKDASNSDFETWERISMFLGLNKWSIGAVDEELEAEMEAIEKRVKKDKKKGKQEKQEVNQIEANKKKQAQEKKEGKKNIKCAAVSKSGNRCKTVIEPGSSYCTIHAKVEQSKSGKKVQCKKMKQVSKKKTKRCGMMTSSKSGYCYYHD